MSQAVHIQNLTAKIQRFAEGSRAKSNVGVAVGLFIVALLPRLFGLATFITADEPLWLVRSISFAEALLTGQFAETLQTGHPGVTTMWTGLAGLGLAYWQQAPTGSFLDFLAQVSHDSDRIDLVLLPWVRLPTVLLAAACVVLLYWWSRSLLDEGIALLGALLLAFDPLFLAHSRTLHHDALATIFITLSILALLNWAGTGPRPGWRYPALSGGLAGLALLSKGSALILVAFTGLFLGWLWLSHKRSYGSILLAGLIWLSLAGGVFVALWPAMWVNPAQVLTEFFGWVLTSAEGDEAAEITTAAWAGRVPELGLLFYPVNWLLKSTFLSLLGLAGLAGWWRDPRRHSQHWVIAWLAVFALLFITLLTLGDKRDGRYLLPIYPALSLLTAAGLKTILDFRFWILDFGFKIPNYKLQTRNPKPETQNSKLETPNPKPQTPNPKLITHLIFVLLLLAFSLPWYPYYHSYYNPLIGGSWLAPRLIKVGWGEGMEQVAEYLNQQENASTLVVATSYANTFLPFFKGTAVKHHQLAPSDYVLNYVRQVQNGYPFPEYWTYYQARSPLLKVREDGLDYAWLYPGPHLKIVRNTEFEHGLTLLGFVLDRAAAQPGQVAQVTLIWRKPAATLPSLKEQIQIQLQDTDGRVWAESRGPVLAAMGPSPVEGHYNLAIPADMPRGDYQLWVSAMAGAARAEVGDRSYQAGIVPVRQLDRPVVSWPAMVNFGDLITFGGAEVTYPPEQTGTIQLTFLWQARRSIPQSYTTFAHVVDSAGQLWGQADRIPRAGQGELPTQQWDKGEWIIDTFELTLKPEAPAGTYTLLAGLYNSQTLERLPVIGGHDGQTVVDITSLVKPPPRE